ncbi:MAG TPA: methionine biosynthesis protein MetW [Rhizomicrobium sp.]|jgi:methionine biosynthesis protein MetW|nr:methionine biosynthesis protein MetW [Rhizomicrobium sp.]
MKILRPDLAAIAALIPPRARVLDVGCGEGDLLEHLAVGKQVDGRGIELSQQNVNACVERGLSVVQGDADTDLADYPSAVFDIVILSQTIQAMRSPRAVLAQLLRIGRHTVVSFPNFGHWRVRLELMFVGRMPQTPALGYSWHETPNIHLCTIADFIALADEVGARIEQAFALSGKGRTRPMRPDSWGPNFLAEGAILMLTAAAPALSPSTHPAI